MWNVGGVCNINAPRDSEMINDKLYNAPRCNQSPYLEFFSLDAVSGRVLETFFRSASVATWL
jgi:hypothetical protein